MVWSRVTMRTYAGMGENNYVNLRSFNCGHVRVVVLLGLISVCGLGAVAGPVHSVTVCNVRVGAVSWGSGHFDFPVGQTVIPLDGAPGSLLSDLSADFGVSLDGSASAVVDVTGGVPGFAVSLYPELNMIDAFGVGFGVGLTFFGFGWVLRLTRRTGEI
jgi:hypothetical protein